MARISFVKREIVRFLCVSYVTSLRLSFLAPQSLRMLLSVTKARFALNAHFGRDIRWRKTKILLLAGALRYVESYELFFVCEHALGAAMVGHTGSCGLPGRDVAAISCLHSIHDFEGDQSLHGKRGPHFSTENDTV